LDFGASRMQKNSRFYPELYAPPGGTYITTRRQHNEIGTARLRDTFVGAGSYWVNLSMEEVERISR